MSPFGGDRRAKNQLAPNQSQQYGGVAATSDRTGMFLFILAAFVMVRYPGETPEGAYP